jgi:translocation and assembly module TamB
MRFFIKYIFITLIATLAATLYILGFTTAGLIFDLNYIAPLFPGKLAVKNIQGTLFSGFSLEDISYKTKEEQVTIHSLSVRWYPTQLLRGKIAIDSLSIDQPRIVTFSSNADADNFSFDDLEILKRISFNTLAIRHLSLKSPAMQLNLDGELKNQWDFQWQVRIPMQYFSSEYSGSINGTGKINGDRLAPVISTNLSSNQLVISQQKIDISLPLKFVGTFTHNQLTGILNLERGRVAIPAFGLQFKDIQTQAQIDKNNIITLAGNFRSGKGTAQLFGTIDLNKPNLPVALTLNGNQLNAVHLPKFKVVISPDIKVNYNYPTLQLQGKIVIPQAKIRLKDYISTVSLPDEVVFAGQPQTNTPTFLAASQLLLEISLGDDVYFSYKDFQTYLGGKITIHQMPNSPATATGEIHAINGKYALYGQKLTIKTGRLMYAGNELSNPTLNIEATRKLKGSGTSASALNAPSLESFTGSTTEVGIRITGTVDNSQVTLFSIPAGMSQTQILAALGGEGAALIGAISAINPGAAKMGNMTGKFTKMLGLTEVNISSVQTFNPTTNQTESTPSFVIGKKISDKLSLHYSVGIFNPISIFNVRYQFNKHWAIQSETSTIDNGADVLYGFERP